MFTTATPADINLSSPVGYRQIKSATFNIYIQGIKGQNIYEHFLVYFAEIKHGVLHVQPITSDVIYLLVWLVQTTSLPFALRLHFLCSKSIFMPTADRK